jgi:ABC-type uncharacterized transport system permease subunit
LTWKLPALILGSVAVLVGALVLSGVNPVEAAKTLFHGSLGTSAAVSGTLRETTPLLIAGLAVFVALRAGLFNIGVEGQLTVGALACAVVALRMPGPVGIVFGLVAGSIAGALWAIPAGWIKAYRNGHEVITTIMLNSVAVFATSYLAAGPFKSKTEQEPTTDILGSSSHLPNLVSAGSFQVSLGLAFGLVAVLVAGFWFKRTVAGYEFQAVGANPTAARFAGVEPKKVIMKAMALSGGIAGFAGAIQVLAYEFRFYEGFSPGYGFDALGVALLAGRSALGIVPASLLFGILAKGGTSLQIDGVPKGITIVVLGLLILDAAAVRYRRVNVVA